MLKEVPFVLVPINPKLAERTCALRGPSNPQVPLHDPHPVPIDIPRRLVVSCGLQQWNKQRCAVHTLRDYVIVTGGNPCVMATAT